MQFLQHAGLSHAQAHKLLRFTKIWDTFCGNCSVNAFCDGFITYNNLLKSLWAFASYV